VKKQIPIWPVIGVAIVIVAAAAYMVVVRPKRAESGRLDEQIAEMQMKVSAAQLASRPQQQATTIKVADVFEVSKAMPDTDDMPGIILDLNSVEAKNQNAYVLLGFFEGLDDWLDAVVRLNKQLHAISPWECCNRYVMNKMRFKVQWMHGHLAAALSASK